VIAANGDITPPALALLEPADDALVGARPVFRLQVSDTGLGVEPGATRIVIDGERVSADCRWETDGLLACVPVDDVTAFYPGVEIRVADFAGNLSESAGITLRLDTDGDGVEDALDTYPDDPSRHRLAPVTGLAATLQDHAVQLAWQTHADPENAAGYLVFRAAAGSDARMQITPQPISSTTYGDAAIENGNGYVYDVIAVDARGNAGETGEQAELFVAWNDISVDGFTAVRELASGHLAWQASGDLRYRIYRSSGGAEGETGEFAVVQEIDAGTFAWLDESTLWHTAYRYRIATLREFTNVFTNESLVLEGPLSEIVTLAPLPPLGIALNDGHPAADGVREILLINTPVAVSGMYSEARGPVTIAATNEQGGSVTGNFTDGGFRLLLPATAGESWTITVSEQLIADRSVQTSVRFIADTAPPAITLDALAAETDDAFLRITGTIVEDLTGIDTLTAHSDRHASQAFGLVLMEAGHFAGEIPLDNGTNVITVRAVDGAGNAAEAAHSVKRRPPLEPTIEIDAPQDGLVTQQPTVDVSGRVYTGLAADQVRILLGGDVQFPESGDGAEGYSFLFEDVPLREGYNLINVSAETPAGGATASVVITHEPEPPPPVEPAPPELSLSTGSLDIVTNGDSLYIGGSASGDGDLTVTVNGEPVDLIGGNFEYLADLVECVDGSATFAITVTDGNGLSTTETITVECDRAAPLLTVASPGALAAPAVTTLPQNPVLFTGTVTDENLAALTLNGMPVNLAPGANPGEYLFDTPVLLPADLALPVHLEARDTAGNSVARDYLLQVASQVGIEIIAPLPQATYLADGDGVNIAVTARFTNFDPVEHQAFVVANNAAPVVFVMSGNVGNIPVAVPATNDEARISVQVRNLAGNVLASRSVDVGITRAADIELAVSRTEPENNATGIAPIDPVTIYFNKPIDPAKLSITVKETVHGMDYDLSVPQGAGYGDLPEPVLIEIHRDMENVEGNLALYEGDRFVSFHPARRFAYGANIFVDVSYAG
ncbi:MAG TPA: hypothetical protein VF267_00230, partial [Gammaproteobacteria bacterium]